MSESPTLIFDENSPLVDAAREVLKPCGPAAQAEPETGSDLLSWACQRWREEVQDRPLVNVHRRTLDDTWRQVIRFAGGDPDAHIGPTHDELLQRSKT